MTPSTCLWAHNHLPPPTGYNSSSRRPSLCGQQALKRHTELHAGKIPIYMKLETVPNTAISGGYLPCKLARRRVWETNQILHLQISHLWRFHDLPYRGQCRLVMSILSGGLKAQEGSTLGSYPMSTLKANMWGIDLPS